MVSGTSCPSCNGNLQQIEIEKRAQFKGVDIAYTAKLHQCEKCRLELADVEEAANIQDQLADAYRKAVGLLHGEEIRRLRQEKGLSQQALADAMDVGIASIKRWETGVIQSKSMDSLLRKFFQNHQCNEYTGSREFSIPRIRLVLNAFAEYLHRSLLEEGDRMLYAAKYLWYADMVAFRDTGFSITGATYAALPMGPQLNNYRDLVDEILKVDLTSVPPLSETELNIIAAVAKTFPSNKRIFDASHREKIWRHCATGAIIPYSSAGQLTEIP